MLKSTNESISETTKVKKHKFFRGKKMFLRDLMLKADCSDYININYPH
jgi:hypothetical protein